MTPSPGPAAGKATVVDEPAAAGGAFLLQNGGPTVEELRQAQGLLRSPAVFRRHVPAALHDHPLSLPLGGFPGRGKAPQLLRADGDELVFLRQGLDGRIPLALSVVAAGAAQKAGRDQDGGRPPAGRGASPRRSAAVRVRPFRAASTRVSPS